MSANYYRSLFAILHSIKNQFPPDCYYQAENVPDTADNDEIL